MKKLIYILTILGLLFPLGGFAQTKKFPVDTNGTLTTNLVSYYKLEDVNDYWASYTLTNTGTTPFNAAKINNGADFGTANSTKKLTNAYQYTTAGGSFSISLWVKLSTEIGANSYQFAGVGVDNASPYTNFAIIYNYNSGTRRLAFNRQKQNVANDSAFYTITLGTTNWYHLVFTYDGSNVRGYVNGVLQAGPTASSGDGTSGGGTTLFIGAPSNSYYDGTYDWTSGIVDEVGYWTKALTRTEITDLYNGGAGQTMCTVGLIVRQQEDDFLS